MTGKMFFHSVNLRLTIWLMVLHRILWSAEDLHLGVTEFPMNPAARNWLEEKQHSLSIAEDCLQEAMVRQASYADRQRQEPESSQKIIRSQQVLVHRDHISACGADGQGLKRKQN